MKCRRDNKPPTFLIITPVFRGCSSPERRAATRFRSPDDTISLSLSLSFSPARLSSAAGYFDVPPSLSTLHTSIPCVLVWFASDCNRDAAAALFLLSFFFPSLPPPPIFFPPPACLPQRRPPLFRFFLCFLGPIVSSARKLVDGAHRKCLRMSATMRNRVLSRVQLAPLQTCPELAFRPRSLLRFSRSMGEWENFQREFAFNLGLVKSFLHEYIYIYIYYSYRFFLI